MDISQVPDDVLQRIASQRQTSSQDISQVPDDVLANIAAQGSSQNPQSSGLLAFLHNQFPNSSTLNAANNYIGNPLEKYVAQPAKEIGADIGTGISQGTLALANMLKTQGQKMMPLSPDLQQARPTINLPQSLPSIQQQLGMPAPNAIDRGITGAASFLPSLLAGKGVTGIASDATSMVPQIANKVLPYLSNPTTSDLLGGALFGSSNNPTHPVEGAFAGADLNAVLGPLTEGLVKAGNAQVAARNYIRGKGNFGEITPEELEANIKAIPAGINLPLGDLANSSSLKRDYGMTGAMFGSGSGAPYDQLNTSVRSTLNNIGNNLGKSSIPQNLNDYIFGKVNDAYQGAKDVRTTAYNNLDNALKSADNNISSFDSTPIQDAITNIKNQIGNKINTTTGAKQYSSILNLMNDINGKNATIPLNNFSDANDLREMINNEYRNNLGPQDAQNRLFINQLRNATDQMVEKNAKNISPTLKPLMDQANNAHKEVLQFERMGTGKNPALSPFKKIVDYNNGAPNTDNFVNSYLGTPGSKESYNNLLRLTSVLPDSDKKIIGANYLFNPQKEEMLDPLSVISRYEKLSPRVSDLLFQDQKPVLDNLKKIKSISPEVFKVDYVPKTGYTGAKALGAGAALASGFSHLFHGDPLTAAGIIGGIPLAGQAIQRTLRSAPLKNFYLNALKANGISSFPAQNGVSQALRAFLTGNLLNGS